MTRYVNIINVTGKLLFIKIINLKVCSWNSEEIVLKNLFNTNSVKKIVDGINV